MKRVQQSLQEYIDNNPLHEQFQKYIEKYGNQQRTTFSVGRMMVTFTRANENEEWSDGMGNTLPKDHFERVKNSPE